jgi:hypothetical protein
MPIFIRKYLLDKWIEDNKKDWFFSPFIFIIYDAKHWKQ